MSVDLVKVAFLDRDGTINVDRGYVHRVEDWQFVPECFEALRLLQKEGFRLAIVTNQSGISAGMYTIQDAERLHEHMRQELAQRGVQVDAVAYCPHSATAGCECRKPQTGMTRQVECILGQSIDYASSWTIGDKPSDIQFGRAAGTKTALIRSRYWVEVDSETRPDLVVDSLFEAALRIVEKAIQG